MNEAQPRSTLKRTVARVRRRLFVEQVFRQVVRIGLIAVPVAAAVVAVDQRWGTGRWSEAVAWGVAGLCLLPPVVLALVRLGTRSRAAWMLDERAALKDRLSSAWEFLRDRDLDEARAAQVRDALAHAASVDLGTALRARLPRFSLLLPALALIFVATFFVPARVNPNVAEASVDLAKQQQLDELKSLQDDLTDVGAQSEEVQQVLDKLRDIDQRFEQGELSERDVMIELARLDEDLRKKMSEPGVEMLDGEVGLLASQLMASASASVVAAALKEEKLDEAAKEMEKLGEKVDKQEVSDDEKKKLAMTMGVAAAKLGARSENSFGGDFKEASEALKSSDSKSFCKSCRSVGNKFKRVSKYRSMKQACKRLSLCKSCLGQCRGKCQCQGLGCKLCSKPGGLKAGTAVSGNPLGTRSRLAESYKKLLEVDGVAGEGPVDSELELTEGQLSPSQVAPRDLYAEYAAVAEEAIEREEIPLSHRFHVKRYFQAIRPAE